MPAINKMARQLDSWCMRRYGPAGISYVAGMVPTSMCERMYWPLIRSIISIIKMCHLEASGVLQIFKCNIYKTKCNPVVASLVPGAKCVSNIKHQDVPPPLVYVLTYACDSGRVEPNGKKAECVI